MLDRVSLRAKKEAFWRLHLEAQSSSDERRRALAWHTEGNKHQSRFGSGSAFAFPQ